jgi:hypothetical protein
VSSTREYERCPRRYRFAYVDKRPYDRPAPVTWRFGSVVHAGLEAAYRHLMDDPGAPRSAAMQAGVAGVQASWQELGMHDDPVGLERAVWHVTRAVAADVVRADDILGVEVGLRAPIGDTERTDDTERVVGIADLVLARGEDTIEIVDHKVTSWRARDDDLRDDLQLNLYGYLAARRWPHATTVLASHHYPTGPDVVRVTLDADRMRAAFDRVIRTAEVARADNAFAPTPSSSCDHCPWLPSCDEGREHLATHRIAS